MKHHYLPVNHQNRWSTVRLGKSKYVFNVDRVATPQRVEINSTRDIFHQSNLYRLIDSEDTDDAQEYRVETRFFGDIDGKYAEVVSRTLRNRLVEFDVADEKALIDFFVASNFRTPSVLETVRNAVDTELKEALARSPGEDLSSMERYLSSECVDRFRKGDTDYVMKNVTVISMMYPVLLRNNRALRRINNVRAVHVQGRFNTFITGDKVAGFVGNLDGDISFYMPISPTCLIVFSTFNEARSREIDSYSLCYNVNRQIWERSTRVILYAGSPGFEDERLPPGRSVLALERQLPFSVNDRWIGDRDHPEHWS
jgi:hypothetical protein